MKRLAITILSFNLLFLFSGCTDLNEMRIKEIIREGDKSLQAYYLESDKSHQKLLALINEIIERDRKIFSNNLILGLTQEEVISLWGNPDKINRSMRSYGTHEQWIYRNVGEYKIPNFREVRDEERGTRYLYFLNNILTGYQD